MKKWNTVYHLFSSDVLTDEEKDNICKEHNIQFKKPSKRECVQDFLRNIYKYQYYVLQDAVYRQKLTKKIYEEIGSDVAIIFTCDYSYDEIEKTLSEIKGMGFEYRTLIVHPEFILRKFCFTHRVDVPISSMYQLKVDIEENTNYPYPVPIGTMTRFYTFIDKIMKSPSVSCIVESQYSFDDGITKPFAWKFYEENGMEVCNLN